MSGTITGELRAAMNVDREYTMGGDVVARTYCMGRDKFTDLCDAIDAVHANLERENESLRRELDRVLGEQEDRDGWVELPKDADGVPWHIGDVTESGQEVKAMGLNRHGWSFVGIVNEIDPAIHHHHAPTVEDVLREFVDEMNQNLGMYTGEAIDADEWRSADNKTIAEFAAKLRLAGDAS